MHMHCKDLCASTLPRRRGHTGAEAGLSFLEGSQEAVQEGVAEPGCFLSLEEGRQGRPRAAHPPEENPFLPDLPRKGAVNTPPSLPSPLS